MFGAMLVRVNGLFYQTRAMLERPTDVIVYRCFMFISTLRYLFIKNKKLSHQLVTQKLMCSVKHSSILVILLNRFRI